MEELMKKLDKELKVINYEYIDDSVIICVKKTTKTAICPCCGKKSSSINTRYYRTIKDLPLQDYKVILKLELKTFFCKNKKCHINTFAETVDFIEPRARMTTRLKDKIVENSKGMSARGSMAVINNGIADISDDTILRLLKKNNSSNK